jgi:DNA-binding transcriptional MerR regulator
MIVIAIFISVSLIDIVSKAATRVIVHPLMMKELFAILLTMSCIIIKCVAFASYIRNSANKLIFNYTLLSKIKPLDSKCTYVYTLNMENKNTQEKLYISELTKIKVDTILKNRELQEERFKFQEKILRMKDTKEAYRVINYWTEIGILSDERENKKSWRKFSNFDLYWLMIVQSLRNFGVSIKVIKKIYEKIFTHLDSFERGLFEVSFLSAISGIPMFFVLFQSGKFGFANFEELVLSEQMYKMNNYIKISLNPFASALLKNSVKEPILKPTLSLSNQELEIIEKIRKGDFESIKIKPLEDESVLLEEGVSQDVTKRVIDILKEASFQKIEISKQNNKVSAIKQTVQTKLKEEKNSPKLNKLSTLLNQSELRSHMKEHNVGSKSKRL